MSVEEMRKQITAVPFYPFIINVADGRRVPVVGRDFVLLAPSGRTVHVYQPDGSYDLLDMLLVTGTSYGPPPATAPTASELPA